MMRQFMATATLSLLAFAGPLRAETPIADHETDADDITATDDSEDAGYNRWVCRAYSNWGRSFYGYSDWFRQGSGEGQRAKREAYREALRKCERHSWGHCRSRIESDCEVQRH